MKDKIYDVFSSKRSVINRFFRNEYLTLLLLATISSCNFDIENINQPVDIAKNITRSKELGLFIHEYNPTSLKINDTIEFEIVEAWVEYNFYSDELAENYNSDKDWYKKKNWKLKKDFDPINGGHLSFLIKGNFKGKYKAYNDNWRFTYCQLIDSEDTSISNNYTYFETYGPQNYGNCPDSIEIKIERYIPPEDSTKYGNLLSFGEFYIKKK